MPSTCPNCRAPVLAGMIFCDDCGIDLRTVSVDQITPTSPPAQSNSPAPFLVCGGCQYHNRPGAVFCESCGSRLSETAAPLSTSASIPGPPETPPLEGNALPLYEPPIKPSQTAVKARLYFPGSNSSLDLPHNQAEIIIGREDAISGVFPDIDLEPYAAQDAGVSRRHIKLHSQGSAWTVEDLNTVNGTFLNRQKLSANQPALLKHGDELRLGKLALIFYLD